MRIPFEWHVVLFRFRSHTHGSISHRFAFAAPFAAGFGERRTRAVRVIAAGIVIAHTAQRSAAVMLENVQRGHAHCPSRPVAAGGAVAAAAGAVAAAAAALLSRARRRRFLLGPAAELVAASSAAISASTVVPPSFVLSLPASSLHTSSAGASSTLISLGADTSASSRFRLIISCASALASARCTAHRTHPAPDAALATASSPSESSRSWESDDIPIFFVTDGTSGGHTTRRAHLKLTPIRNFRKVSLQYKPRGTEDTRY